MPAHINSFQKTRINERSLDFSAKARLRADAEAELSRRRWHRLCERYLPVEFDDSVWRYNRFRKPREPSQGWKLHVSATILEACDLFERVAPFLISEDVQFKAPNHLDALSKINCGLHYGYHQVGKFITVYPSSEKRAVELASRLDELTKEFSKISVPFDEQYLPESSVFYRYGAFSNIEVKSEDGKTFPAVMNSAGEYVQDDRLRAVPEWLSDPFPNGGKPSEKTFAKTPLGTTYRIFQSLTQRGKGGTYRAVDLSRTEPRLCIVKEGRRNGELGWDGQDGYLLVENEFEVLSVLKERYDAVPQAFASFEIYGNFYFAMEYVEGESLGEIMKRRQRRFSTGKVVELAIKIAEIIEKIHRAGWIWNDCKPANLIVLNDKSLRPIDFENAHPVNQPELFDWKSQGFSKSLLPSIKTDGKSGDLYALGAVIYFLLTGKLYEGEESPPIKKLRRGVPRKLVETTEKLLSGSDTNISEARKELDGIKEHLSRL